jgi:transcriptional/translational regulatory protein YebC/TACO1
LQGKSDALKMKMNARYGKLVLQACAHPHRSHENDGCKRAHVQAANAAGKTQTLNARGPAALCRAKAGGSNPDSNRQLQNTIDGARRAGVPKDIIERNLKRADEKGGADIEEHLIELYGPGGTGFVMDCLTDNKQRAHTDIWTVVKKLNGKVRASCIS